MDKYPEELPDRYDIEKEMEDLNKRFGVLDDDANNLVQKSNSEKKAFRVFSEKIDESMAVLGQIDEVKKMKYPVGIDVEETERNIESLQVIYSLKSSYSCFLSSFLSSLSSTDKF